MHAWSRLRTVRSRADHAGMLGAPLPCSPCLARCVSRQGWTDRTAHPRVPLPMSLDRRPSPAHPNTVIPCSAAAKVYLSEGRDAAKLRRLQVSRSCCCCSCDSRLSARLLHLLLSMPPLAASHTAPMYRRRAGCHALRRCPASLLSMSKGHIISFAPLRELTTHRRWQAPSRASRWAMSSWMSRTTGST